MKKYTKTGIASALVLGMAFSPVGVSASDSDNLDNDSLQEEQNGEVNISPLKANVLMEGGHILKQGAAESAVASIQKELNDRGIETTVDGMYGPETVQSVKMFQQKYSHLTVDGIVGPNTFTQLNMASMNYPNRLLYNGVSNDYVGSVQNKLTEVGISTMEDNIYGPKTEASVKEYQEMNGLMVDGIVGPNTWDSMFSPQNSDENSSNKITSGEQAIEKVKNSEDFGEDIIFDDLGGELSEDDQGSYYTVQLTSKELMKDGGSGTVDEFKVYQNGDYVSVYGNSEQ